MSPFESPLIMEDISESGHGNSRFILRVPLVYYSKSLNKTIVVPEGFVTDLASVPVGLWNILPKQGPWDKAAVVHDYLYVMNGVTRKEADGVLLEAMQDLKVSAWQSRLIYMGVRVGGWLPWKNYREGRSNGDTV